MAFKTTVAAGIPDIDAGEVIKSAPYDVQAYVDFEEGLLAGRFCQLKADVVSNMDGTATPKLVGIPRRKVTGEIADVSAYTKIGEGYDSVAEVIELGYATVQVATGAAPKRHTPVNVINEASNAENGMATDAAVATGIISAGNVVFWEQKASGVWLIRFNNYL